VEMELKEVLEAINQRKRGVRGYKYPNLKK
jgi:hypothetical protein